jgi:hypothetical protein
MPVHCLKFLCLLCSSEATWKGGSKIQNANLNVGHAFVSKVFLSSFLFTQLKLGKHSKSEKFSRLLFAKNFFSFPEHQFKCFFESDHYCEREEKFF